MILAPIVNNPVYRVEDYLREPVGKTQKQKLIDDFLRSVDRLSDAHKYYGVPVSFDPTRAMDNIEEDEYFQRFNPILDKKYKGILEPEHILTVASLISTFLEDPCKDLLLWGTYQLGKTMNFTTGYCLLPVVNKLMRDVITIPFINTFANNNVKNQIQKELSNMLLVYGDVDVTYNGKRQAFNYVEKKIRDSVFASIPSNGWNKLIDNRTVLSLENDNIVKELVKNQFPNSKLEFQMWCDEIQLGTKKDSVLDQLREKYESLTMIRLSATRAEASCSAKVKSVPSWVGPYYQGPIEYNRAKLPTINPNHNNDVKYINLSDLLWGR